MLCDNWYTACASLRLTDGPLAVQILDEKLVVFRLPDGRLGALRDACPHRGYPLSKGRVKERTLQCGFHGWEFAPDGCCCRVPSLDKATAIPKVFSTRHFPIVERDGFVWVWMGEGEPASERLPLVPHFSSQAWLQGSLVLACDFVKAVEINVDGSHVYFVHPRHPATLANASAPHAAPPRNEIRLTARGFVTFWPATENPGDPIPPDAETITFELPNRVTIGSVGKGYSVELFFVPVGEGRCRLEYLVSQPQGAGHAVRWIDGIPEIFAEDKLILEAIEQTGRCEKGFVEKNVPADTAPLLARRMIAALCKGDWESVLSQMEPRIIF